MTPSRKNAIASGKLTVVAYTERLAPAYELMREGGFRHLPVVDETGHIVGVLSDRDVQRAMVPHRDYGEPHKVVFSFRDDMLVRDFMTAPVLSIDVSLPVLDVVRRMMKEKVSSFLVTDAQRDCLGILTTDDLLELLAARLDCDEKLNRTPLAESSGPT